MKSTILKTWALSFFLPLLLFLPMHAGAYGSGFIETQEGFGYDNPIGEVYGSDEPEDIRVIVANIIKIILGFIGLILLILLIVAGFRWMTSGGNESKIGESKSQITAAIIGLIIILASYALATYITDCVYGATGGEEGWMC